MMDKELGRMIPRELARGYPRLIRITREEMLGELEPHIENGKTYLIKFAMLDGGGLTDTQLRLSLKEVPCYRPRFDWEEKRNGDMA